MNARILAMGLIVAGTVTAVIVHRHRQMVAHDLALRQETVPGAPLVQPNIAEPVVDDPSVTTAKKTLPPATAPAAIKPAIIRPRPVMMVKKTTAANTTQNVGPNAAPVHPAVPVARAALTFVGMDDDADFIWGMTINDPSVPAEARKDLIEDLNEDGFPDPKHITAADLPLILSRMELIEELAPDSMDETNAAAFMEAYKDLVGMMTKAIQ